jgi:hypothetical protein
MSNWCNHTKDFASANNTSFKNSLSNNTNRMDYYDTQIDRSKTSRGPFLLQSDHPAMHPFIPGLTPQQKSVKDEILIQTKRSMAGKEVQFKKK